MKASEILIAFLAEILNQPRFLQQDRDDLTTARKERIWLKAFDAFDSRCKCLACTTQRFREAEHFRLLEKSATHA